MMLSALFPNYKLTDSLDRSRYEHFCRQCVQLHYPQYGDGHFILACYAAFPAVMSPDLLHRLWLNFGAYKQYGQETRIHPVAVSDVLLSSLFNETGFESYEMPKALRLFFLEYWQKLPPQYKTEFGLHEPAEVAEFLTQYIDNQRDKLDSLTWEKQRYMSLSYLNPQALTFELAQKMKEAIVPRDKLRYAQAIITIGENYKIYLAKEQQKIPYDFEKLTQAAKSQINLLFNKMSEAEEIYNGMAQKGAVDGDAKVDKVAIEIDEEIAVKIKVEKPKRSPKIHYGGKTLYAVLVAIDKYPIPAHQLNGCVNDATAFSDYLKSYCEASGIVFNEKRLFDDAAKRQDIIESFKHFERAKEHDICVFYYVGHGSQIKAPPEEFKPNGMWSSFVCWDSRMKGSGLDLLSPEIAYLIYKATHNIDIHFLFISDCAHSGNITRGLITTTPILSQTRMVDTAPTTSTSTRFENLLGLSEWVGYRPPTGKHIHLASCADDETDKEYPINGQHRGVFNYYLVETLNQINGLFINYNEIIERVKQKVRNSVKEQTPMLNYYGYSSIEMQSLGFLGERQEPKPSFLVGYDKNTEGWIVMGGGVQGVNVNTVFELETGQTLELGKISTNFSLLKNLEFEDKEKQFQAVLKNANIGFPVVFSFSEESDTEGVEILKKIFETKQWESIALTEDIKSADFIIKIYAESFQLLNTVDTTPLFKRVQGYKEESALQFWNHCLKVAHWRQVLEIANPLTSISDDALEITFYDSKGGVVTNAKYYQLISDEHAIMRVSITNRWNKAIWVSAVYLGSDFMISNEFLRHSKLNPGETAWLEYEGDRLIAFIVQPEYLSQGITTLIEYFKIFVSTDFINTDIHNQDGLLLEGDANYGRKTTNFQDSEQGFPNQETTRSIGRSSSKLLEDWRTYERAFTINFSEEATIEIPSAVIEPKTPKPKKPKKAESKPIFPPSKIKKK